MSEAKPTPGPCWVDVHHNVKSARGMIAFPCLSSGCDQETVAHMIAQTFNVHYTTGMTPVQLVEQREQLVERVKELEGVLQAAVDCGMVPKSSAADGGASKYSAQVLVADRIRAALSKARPNTAEGESAVSEVEFKQFLADVHTAAGLVSHGRRCKALGERLGGMVMCLLAAGAPPALNGWRWVPVQDTEATEGQRDSIEIALAFVVALLLLVVVASPWIA